MHGANVMERARIREAERIADLGVLLAVGTIFQNTSPFFAGRIKQSPAAPETGKARLAATTRVVDQMIGSKPFIAGAKPTIADCTLFAALEFATVAQSH